MKKRLTSIAASLAIVSFAGAQVININFVSSNGSNSNVTISGSGLGPASYAGTSWNNPLNSDANGGTTTSLSDMQDSEGNPTTVDFSFGSWGSFSYTNTSLDILENYIYQSPSNGSPQSFSFSGLTASGLYDIYFVSQGDSDGQGASYTIGSTTLSTTGSDASASTFVEGQNFVVFSGLQADGSGTISGTWDHLPSEFGATNAIQIVAVPEFSSAAAIIGFVAAGMVVLRRRMR